MLEQEARESKPEERRGSLDLPRIIIAEVRRARGNKGEVLVASQTDVPGRLENLAQARLRLPDGSDITLDVESVWPYRADWVIKFVGVDTISEAERLEGADVWVTPEERGALPDGRYFLSDLVGCLVVDSKSGEPIGPVTGYQDFGAATLLEVAHGGRTVLVPLVVEICPVIDIQTQTIRADLPDGLLDL